MLEYATFGVISPKACANILWKDTSREMEAAELLKLTANDLKSFGFVDTIIDEENNDKNNFNTIADKVKCEIIKQLDIYKNTPIHELLKNRYDKYMSF